MRSTPMPVSMFLAGSSPAMSKSTLLRTGRQLVLHEDEVPDLEVAVLVGDRAALLAVLGAAVEVDLRAGTAGAGNAHVPVVVGLVATLHPLGRQPDHVGPERERLVVVEVDGGPQPLRVEAEAAVGDATRSAAPTPSGSRRP